MTPVRRPPVRAIAIAVAAAGGVIGGHLLDALGLLPGVRESAAVRAAALAPRYTVLTIVGAAALAVGVDALLRRRRSWFAVSALIVGQSALLGLPEALAELGVGRADGRGGGARDELAAVAVAVALQVLLSAGTVVVAVVVAAVLVQICRTWSSWPPSHYADATRVAESPRRGRGLRGMPSRGPPVPVTP